MRPLFGFFEAGDVWNGTTDALKKMHSKKAAANTAQPMCWENAQ